MRFRKVATFFWSLPLLILLFGSSVYGDGCFVWNGVERLREPNQKAIIVFENDREDLFLQVKYEGSINDFGWIVPLPAKPEVLPVTFSCFGQLDSKHHLGEKLYCTPVDLYHVWEERLTATLSADSSGIRVSPPLEISDFSIRILESEDGQELMNWLKENRFQVPENGQSVLDDYIRRKWCFAVMTVKASSRTREKEVALQQGELPPVHFAFTTPQPVFPLYISSLNKGETHLQLFLFARELYMNEFFLPADPDTGAKPGASRPFPYDSENRDRESVSLEKEPVAYYIRNLLPGIAYECKRPLPGKWFCSRFEKKVDCASIREDLLFSSDPGPIEEAVRRIKQQELLDGYDFAGNRITQLKNPYYYLSRNGPIINYNHTFVDAVLDVKKIMAAKDPVEETKSQVMAPFQVPSRLNPEKEGGSQSVENKQNRIANENGTPKKDDIAEIWDDRTDSEQDEDVDQESRNYIEGRAHFAECLKNPDIERFSREYLSTDWILPFRYNTGSFSEGNEDLKRREFLTATYCEESATPDLKNLNMYENIFKQNKLSGESAADGDSSAGGPALSQKKCLDLLVKYRDPIACKYLSHWLDCRYPVNVRRTALAVMLSTFGNALQQTNGWRPYICESAMDYRDEVLPKIRPFLKNRDLVTRLTAARLVALFRDEQSVPFFKESLALFPPATVPDYGSFRNTDLQNKEDGSRKWRQDFTQTALVAFSRRPCREYADELLNVMDRVRDPDRMISNELKWDIIYAAAFYGEYPEVLDALFERFDPGDAGRFSIILKTPFRNWLEKKCRTSPSRKWLLWRDFIQMPGTPEGYEHFPETIRYYLNEGNLLLKDFAEFDKGHYSWVVSTQKMSDLKRKYSVQSIDLFNTLQKRRNEWLLVSNPDPELLEWICQNISCDVRDCSELEKRRELMQEIFMRPGFPDILEQSGCGEDAMEFLIQSAFFNRKNLEKHIQNLSRKPLEQAFCRQLLDLWLKNDRASDSTDNKWWKSFHGDYDLEKRFLHFTETHQLDPMIWAYFLYYFHWDHSYRNDEDSYQVDTALTQLICVPYYRWMVPALYEKYRNRFQEGLHVRNDEGYWNRATYDLYLNNLDGVNKLPQEMVGKAGFLRDRVLPCLKPESTVWTPLEKRYMRAVLKRDGIPGSEDPGK